LHRGLRSKRCPSSGSSCRPSSACSSSRPLPRRA
jgi:hypothetical protein